jgi:hypothetical protein
MDPPALAGGARDLHPQRRPACSSALAGDARGAGGAADPRHPSALAGDAGGTADAEQVAALTRWRQRQSGSRVSWRVGFTRLG